MTLQGCRFRAEPAQGQLNSLNILKPNGWGFLKYELKKKQPKNSTKKAHTQPQTVNFTHAKT